MECIVLAGGLGTRLQGVIGQYPKCMAEVNGKPFLYYIFRYLEEQGCARVVLSLGFKSEIVKDWLSSQTWNFEIDDVIEEEPLGTGGGISLAMSKCNEDHVIVLNGDTMFRVPLGALLKAHRQQSAETTLAVKQMQDAGRYGLVEMDTHNRITAFREKGSASSGSINGGVYVVNKEALLNRKLPQKYSFEKDYLEAFVKEGTFFGFPSSGYFIDIGIPEDYSKAQQDFKTMFE